MPEPSVKSQRMNDSKVQVPGLSIPMRPVRNNSLSAMTQGHGASQIYVILQEIGPKRYIPLNLVSKRNGPPEPSVPGVQLDPCGVIGHMYNGSRSTVHLC